MAEIGKEVITESLSKDYQRALDLEAMGLMGITPEEKYRREVAVAFDADQGGLTLAKGAKVLDLACGRGDTTKLIQEKGYDVRGVDFSGSAVDEARERFSDSGIDFQEGDMMRPPKIEGGYDAITCFGRSLAYFEKYENYTETLRNWHESLKDGGKVAIEWTEWATGTNESDAWQSVGNTTVNTEPELQIKDDTTGETLSYMDSRTEYLEYPGEQLSQPVEKHYGGRLYVDSNGKRHELGNKDTLFVDLLKERNFPLLKRMLEETGFENVKLAKAPESLTPEGNPKVCNVFSITAEKHSEGSVVSMARGKVGNALAG